MRTSEFLWQEGHSVHASKNEAIERTHMMLDVYTRLAEDFLAIPVIKGRKSASERFPGAVDTLSMEAMTQDRKALQAGTSHFLGQNFAKASAIKFQSAQETEEYAWTVSWGASTRLIGGLIMTHADDDGVILPPKVASSHVVLLPIVKKVKDRQGVMAYTESLAKELRDKIYHQRRLKVEIDDRDIGGARGWDWIKKGIPLRVEIGPKDIADNAVFVGRRDKAHRDRVSFKKDHFSGQVLNILDEIQETLFTRALTLREEHTAVIDDKDTFYRYFTPKNQEKPEIHGGFSLSHWCGEDHCEAKIKEDLKVTIRCIPLENETENGECICCRKPSDRRVVFAKAY